MKGGYNVSPLTGCNLYNGTKWSATGAMSGSRYIHASGYDLTNGISMGGENGGQLSTTEEFASGIWSAGGALATARNANSGGMNS